LAFWYTKYNRFHKRNAKDIQSLKNSAMKSQNYEKVDEFYLYQDYLDKSYFGQIVKYLKNVSQFREKITNDAWIADFCSGVGAKNYEFLGEKFEDLTDQGLDVAFKRTQDLAVWVSKYSYVPKFEEIQSQWNVSDFYTTAKDDPIFGYIKFSEKCNFKPGLANSLYVLEHPLIFQILRGCVHLTAYAFSKIEGEEVQKVSESVKNKLNALEQILIENPQIVGSPENQKSVRQFMLFLKGWYAITALALKVAPLKDIKADAEKFNKTLEEESKEISSKIEEIETSIFNFDVEA
jgi:hypothetical protein